LCAVCAYLSRRRSTLPLELVAFEESVDLA
jgi:hypothetical protein